MFFFFFSRAILMKYFRFSSSKTNYMCSIFAWTTRKTKTHFAYLCFFTRNQNIEIYNRNRNRNIYFCNAKPPTKFAKVRDRNCWTNWPFNENWMFHTTIGSLETVINCLLFSVDKLNKQFNFFRRKKKEYRSVPTKTDKNVWNVKNENCLFIKLVWSSLFWSETICIFAN